MGIATCSKIERKKKDLRFPGTLEDTKSISGSDAISIALKLLANQGLLPFNIIAFVQMN